MKGTSVPERETSSFCKCLLLSCSDLDIELGAVMRSREKYNFIHRELTVKQRKGDYIYIKRIHKGAGESRSALC